MVDFSPYTDIIFAFAGINQDMTVGLSDPADDVLLRDVVSRRSGSQKITIAVGGMSFLPLLSWLPRTEAVEQGGRSRTTSRQSPCSLL